MGFEVSKTELREQLRLKRLQLTGAERSQREKRICDRAKSLISKSQDQVWTAYSPFRGEVDPFALTQLVGVKWAFPVIRLGQMQFLLPRVPHQFVVGAFGLQEPDPDFSDEVSGGEIAGCLVPGVAFDRECWRLGSGKGFYDRFLDSFGGRSVGLAFDIQIVEKLPREGHDVPVHFVVTENETLERA